MSDINDQELEQYLDGNSDVSKRYQAESQPEIPARIDDTILGIAKMSTDAQRSAERSSLHSWYRPLSIAAVFVLSVSLVLTMYDEYGEDYLQTPNQPALEQINSSAPVAAEELIPADVEQKQRDGEAQIEPSESSQSYDLTDDSFQSDVIEQEHQQATEELSGSIRKKAARAEPILLEQQEEQEQLSEIEMPAEFLDKPASTNTGQMPDLDQEPAALNVDKIDKTEGAETILGINKQIEVLESEVEDLKQTQEKLLLERATLEADLRQVEQQRTEIKRKISSEDSVTEEPSLQAELDSIKDLWTQNQQQQAISRLQRFRETYPVISDTDLLSTLPAALVEAAK